MNSNPTINEKAEIASAMQVARNFALARARATKAMDDIIAMKMFGDFFVTAAERKKLSEAERVLVDIKNRTGEHDAMNHAIKVLIERQGTE